MSFALRESSVPGVWEVVYAGEVDVQMRLMALEGGRGILEEGMARGVLADYRRAHVRTSREQAYQLAVERVSESILLGVRVALLFEEIPEEIEFEAAVARNRGLEFKTFCDRELAMEWLDLQPS